MNNIIIGDSDFFNGFAPSPYTTFDAWSAAMDEYIATMKANKGNNKDVLVYADDLEFSHSNGGFYTGQGYMSPTFTSGHNIPGYTWKSLLAALSAKLHAQGMTLSLQCGPANNYDANHGPNGIWGQYTCVQDFIHSNVDVQQAYITDLCRMTVDVNPDVILIIQEPQTTYAISLTTTYYAFLQSACAQIKAANPNVKCAVMANPWWFDDPEHNPDVFLDNMCAGDTGKWINLPADTMFYSHAGMYQYQNTESPPTYPDWAISYYLRDWVNAKAQLIAAYAKAKYAWGSLGIINALARDIPVVIENIGCDEHLRSTYNGGNDDNKDKLQFLKDLGEWCAQNGVGWNTSGIPLAGGWGTPSSWVFSTPSSLNAFGKAIYATVQASAPAPSPRTLSTPVILPPVLSKSTISLGESVTTLMTVSGGKGIPTGTVNSTVSVTGINGEYKVFGSPKTLVDGVAVSESYATNIPGTYYFGVMYSGDSHYSIYCSSGPATLIVTSIPQPAPAPTINYQELFNTDETKIVDLTAQVKTLQTQANTDNALIVTLQKKISVAQQSLQ